MNAGKASPRPKRGRPLPCGALLRPDGTIFYRLAELGLLGCSNLSTWVSTKHNLAPWLLGLHERPRGELLRRSSMLRARTAMRRRSGSCGSPMFWRSPA